MVDEIPFAVVLDGAEAATENGTSSTISMCPRPWSRCRCRRRPWNRFREMSIERRTWLGPHRPAPGCGFCGFPSCSRATPSIPARSPSAPTPAPATPAASQTIFPSCWRFHCLLEDKVSCTLLLCTRELLSGADSVYAVTGLPGKCRHYRLQCTENQLIQRVCVYTEAACRG